MAASLEQENIYTCIFSEACLHSRLPHTRNLDIVNHLPRDYRACPSWYLSNTSPSSL